MKYAAIFIVIGVSGAAIGQQWLPGWGDPRIGVGGTLNAVTVWDRDGTGPAAPTVVVGLGGTMPGSQARLGYWDRGWAPINTSAAPPLFAVASHNGELYARTGSVTSWGISQANANVARWDGTRWWGASMGPVTEIHTLFSYQGQLLGPGSGAQVLAWNGTAWSGMGTATSQAVNAMAVHNGELIAAGATLSRWTGSGWVPWLTAIPGVSYIQALASLNGRLYAGHTGGLHVWNGTSWEAAPGGNPGQIWEMVVHEGELRCVGVFTFDGLPYEALRFDGQAWRTFGSGLDGTVVDSCMWRGQAVVAGSFVHAGGVYAGGAAVRSGDGYAPLGAGLRRAGSWVTISAVAEHNNDLYVAGNFTLAGGQPAAGIARWDGSSWSALGSGVDSGGAISSMISYNGELVVTGSFTSIGGVSAQRLAAWNGASWRQLGFGFNSGSPGPMAVRGNELFIGLNTISGGVSLKRWNGTAISQLGADESWGTVRSLLAVGNTLYVGGIFRVGDGPIIMTPSMRWIGESGAYIGASGHMIVDLTERNGSVYSAIGSGRGIQRLQGGAWVADAAGVRGSSGVNTLLNVDGDLLAGGTFTDVYHTSSPSSLYSPSAYVGIWSDRVCGTADFNGDGDVGTDADIESFFACLAGSCCVTCWHLGADFNGDGDVGTDGDIEAFFRVLAGNAC